MTQNTSPAQPDAAERFAGQIVDWLNGGAICLMISLGHRAGLFDAMADCKPRTSAEIAAHAGRDERYVREWLGAMTTAGIVQHDAADANHTIRFTLPPEHAVSLARNTGAQNLAVIAQYIGLLGAVEDAVLDAFSHGRGVPYDAYTRFPEVMAEDSNQGTVQALQQHIIPLVPGLADRLTRGIDVVDVGCGRGIALLELAALYPNSRFLGLDLLPSHTEWAAAEAARRGLTNADFRVHDTTEPFAEEAFDHAFTFDAIHDQRHPQRVLQNIFRALRPHGTYLCQEIKGSSCIHCNTEHAIGPLLYTISCMHCMSVSLAQGGPGLGAMWGREMATEFFASAGFTDATRHELAHDIQNDYYVMARAPQPATV